jgi:hypothetical protein
MKITEYEGRLVIEGVNFSEARPAALLPLGGWLGRMLLAKEWGRLVLSEYWLQFFGQRVELNIPLRDIAEVTVVQIAREVLNEWVQIRYGENREAWFKESDMLGWSTLGGSSPRIASLIRKAIAGSLPATQPGEHH